MDEEIKKYNARQNGEPKLICDLLAKQIQRALPKAENKIWHGAPVWFLEGNPVVGYWVRKDHVQLLFWSGQSFEETGLQPNGSFKAAEARYVNKDQVDVDELKKWLAKSEAIQWDYKNIVKRRGELLRLK